MKTNIKTHKQKIVFFIFCGIGLQIPALFSAASAAADTDSSNFMKAVEKADLEKVQDFLAKGIDTETKNSYGATALMLAAYHGHTEIIDTLCMSKADINSRDSTQKTPLMYAASSSNALALKHLLAFGADYSLKNGLNIDLRLLLSKKVSNIIDKGDMVKAEIFKKHKENLFELVATYKQDTIIPEKELILFFPPKQYTRATTEEELACHQRDIMAIKKVLFVLELENILNKPNLLDEMTDYLAPFIQE